MLYSIFHDDGIWLAVKGRLNPVGCFQEGIDSTCSLLQTSLSRNVEIWIGSDKVGTLLKCQSRLCRLLLTHFPVQPHYYIVWIVCILYVASVFYGMVKPDITDNVDFLAQFFLLHIVNSC